MTHATLFFNPSSGGYSPQRADRIVRQLRVAGIEAAVAFPGSESGARRMVRELCDAGDEPLIIAAGGDGTVNTVINGMLPGRGTLGVIPLGTANVIGHELDIRSVDDAIAAIANGVRRPFSVGEISCGETSRRFLLMAGIGIDGAIVAGVRDREKRRFGRMAYCLSAVREICRWDRSPLVVATGGFCTRCSSVIVSNASRYAGRYRINRTTSIFHRSLEVIPFEWKSPITFLLTAITTAVTGRLSSPRDGVAITTGEITISGDRPGQVDGDPFGRGEMVIRLIPDFAQIITTAT